MGYRDLSLSYRIAIKILSLSLAFAVAPALGGPIGAAPEDLGIVSPITPSLAESGPSVMAGSGLPERDGLNLQTEPVPIWDDLSHQSITRRAFGEPSALRGVLRRYVNVRTDKSKASPAAAGFRHDIQTDLIVDLPDLGLRGMLLDSELLGFLAESMLGMPHGEPGFQWFELMGLQLVVELSTEGTMSVHELSTGSTLAAAPPLGRSNPDPRLQSDQRPRELVMVRQLLEFLRSPLGMTVALLALIAVAARGTVMVARALKHLCNRDFRPAKRSRRSGAHAPQRQTIRREAPYAARRIEQNRL